MSNPLISFIIPYYNIPATMLEECVESVMRVALSAIERQVLVVDDGSELDMENRLRLICPDIIYIRQPNAGPGAARNTGIEHATGTYIQFVDGDDTLLQHSYNQCVEKLRTCSPDAIIFSSSHDSKAAESSTIMWHQPTTGAQYMCCHNVHARPYEYAFRKDILAGLRFPEGIFHEDEEFSPQLIVRARTLWHTAAVAYYYRVRPNSTMNNHSEAFISKRLDYMPGIIDRLRIAAGSLTDTAREGMDRKVAQLTMDYIFNMMRLQRDRRRVAGRIAQLRAMGLYPLPRRRYTRAYTIFTLLANNRCGLALLYAMLPFVRHTDY